MEEIEISLQKVKHRWWRSSVFKIYSSHSLSSWGDRMWSFALGIYLYYLHPDSLRLTAVYGFSTCISVIVLGAAIGRWIDKTQRLKAAQVSLIVQNLSVVLCATMLFVKLEFSQDIYIIWGGILDQILIGMIILIGVIADLGSVATKLALQKDWIVVLAEGNSNKLAKMNSAMRTIDLTTSILAPVIVGQILTYGGRIFSVAFIVGWNVISVAVEYYLLISIYKQTPELGRKAVLLQDLNPPDKENKKLQKNMQVSTTTETPENGKLPLKQLAEAPLGAPKQQRPLGSLLKDRSSIAENNIEEVETKTSSTENTSCLSIITKRVLETASGWNNYFHHHVRNAGLALSLLYMTVLGFDNITRGYALSQGVTESYLGIFTAIGAVFGILGSLSFPYLRKKFGKLTTGNVGFGSETFCLLICVVSIFTPGSPFVHYKLIGRNKIVTPSNGGPYSLTELWNNHISVLLLLSGIVLARFGLWIADLSVSQIFQESVAENERGVINGVQGSLNQGMNLIKFILVIALPQPSTFAYLIALSWLFILLGWILFMTFSCSTHKTDTCVGIQANGDRAPNPTTSPPLSVSIATDDKRGVQLK